MISTFYQREKSANESDNNFCRAAQRTYGQYEPILEAEIDRDSVFTGRSNKDSTKSDAHDLGKE